MEIFKVLLTALLSVAALFIITKIMGHKQISQMDFFDYVSGITIGSIGAELATDLEHPERALIALCIYGLASYLFNFFGIKFQKTRKYINGAPTMLFDKGNFYRENLKKCKLELSEFLMLCREEGYFDLSAIQTAVFEYNGKLSILPKAADRPVTPQDLKISAKNKPLGVEVIMDGHVIEKNLAACKRDESWLSKKLNAQKYKSPKEVFLGIYLPETDELSLYQNHKKSIY